MKKATALLLNWKRPNNLISILKSIRRQTIPIDIFLWNNNSEDKNDYDVDLRIDSSQNLICWPRWLMSSFAETEYIFTLDDDLIFTENNIIEKCIDYFQKNELFFNTIIGKYGVVFNSNKKYFKSDHVEAGNEDVKVDVVKGRFMFMRKHFITHVKLIFNIREDDIYISSYSRNKIIPAFLSSGFKNLKQGDVSLWKESKHKKSRQEAVENYHA